MLKSSKQYKYMANRVSNPPAGGNVAFIQGPTDWHIQTYFKLTFAYM